MSLESDWPSRRRPPLDNALLRGPRRNYMQPISFMVSGRGPTGEALVL